MTLRVSDRVKVFNTYRVLKLLAHHKDLAMILVVEWNAASVVPYIIPEDPLERDLLSNEEESKYELVEELVQVHNLAC